MLARANTAPTNTMIIFFFFWPAFGAYSPDIVFKSAAHAAPTIWVISIKP
jgi:hypothetical protein